MRQNNGLKKVIIMVGLKKIFHPTHSRKENTTKNPVFSFQKQLKKNNKSEFPIIAGFFIGAVRNLKENMKLTMIGKMEHIAGHSPTKNL